MKKIITIPFFILLVYCSSSKNIIEEEENIKKEAVITKEKKSCPEDGICTIEILKNKSLHIKFDEINSIYYQVEENLETSIIKYKYTRNTIKDAQDASYIEEIIFEIKNTETDLKLFDTNLQNTKMLFGRHCFCKEQAGYYKITDGNLTLIKEKETYKVDLNFTINEVPQIIQNVTFVQ